MLFYTVGIICPFIFAIVLVVNDKPEWMWWPILFSFTVLLTVKIIPPSEKKPGEPTDVKKVLKILLPYIIAIIMSGISAIGGVAIGGSNMEEANKIVDDLP